MRLTMSMLLATTLTTFSVPALAAPTLMGYSGHLVDLSDVPYDGPHDFVIGIYTSSSSGTLVFEETFDNEPVDAGYFYLLLSSNQVGGGNDLELVFAASDELYFQLEVDGTVLSPRQRIASVPWALGSSGGGGGGSRLDSISSASCSAGQVLQYESSNDTFYCDADDVGTGGGGGDITGVSAGTGLAGGGSSGDVSLRVDMGAVAAYDHTHTGSGGSGDITGVSAGSGLSGGGTSGDVSLSVNYSDVARQSHNHAGADINSGTVAFGRLPTGTGATQVAVGNHTHSSNAVIKASSATVDGATVLCGGSAKASGGGCSSASNLKASYPLSDGGALPTNNAIPRGWACGCLSSGCTVTAYAICMN